MILELQENTSASEKLAAIRDLYERGRMLQAYQAGLGLGPLHTWQGTEAQVMAGRLAGHLGAMRQSAWLLRCAYRARRTTRKRATTTPMASGGGGGRMPPGGG